MKINIDQIPPEGLTLEEAVLPLTLDVETDIVKFRGPIKIKAEISKITNTVTVDVVLTYSMYVTCSRCLNEFAIDTFGDKPQCLSLGNQSRKPEGLKKAGCLSLSVSTLSIPVIKYSKQTPMLAIGVYECVDLKKNLRLNYPISKLEPIIDLDSDIREEIILDYPLKPLCNPNCKGLCPKCGKNLNEGECNCVY